jgi:phosphoesterase RecJ-like protein
VEDDVPLDSYDAVIVVDCADKERLGERGVIFEEISPKICLDHHISNTQYADYNYVDSSAAATGEVIYAFCGELEIPIDLSLATDIYLAVSSDTGCFRQANTTPRTMEIAAKMMSLGVHNYDVNKRMFARTKVRLELMREYLDTLEFAHDDRITIATLTNERIALCGGTYADCDGLVSIGKNISGVEVSIFLRENEEGKVKVSLRSDELDVAAICAKFGGGGHLRAAGCEVEGDIEYAKREVLGEILNGLEMWK